MMEVPLSRGKVALVDDDDYEEVSRYTWYAAKADNIWYAQTHVRYAPCHYGKLRMHNLIMRAKPGSIVDHKNGNGLDNRRDNLRHASLSQNGANARKTTRPRSSQFKGVSRSHHGKWCVNMCVENDKRHLGYFDTETEAARAYDRAALVAWGGYACLNFPDKARP